MTDVTLTLTGLVRRYGAVAAVAGVDLTVGDGETVALLGPSGCGKSTLLRLVAGLEPPDAGRITLGGQDLTGVPAERRGVGMVFQDFALFPHLSVRDNVAFGLVEQGVTGDAREARVAALLERMGLGAEADRRPDQLSGGQQQRVALARALAPEPDLLLLDEPLSNLDRTLKAELLGFLADLLADARVRAIYVTHDQEEAFTVGDRVAVMRGGHIQQVGTPQALAAQPGDAWTAGFLGVREVLPDAVVRMLGLSGPTLLRVDALAPDDAGTAFTVTSVRLVGEAVQLGLQHNDWGVELAWRGHAREFAGDVPVVGHEVRMRVPDDAWVPLETQA